MSKELLWEKAPCWPWQGVHDVVFVVVVVVVGVVVADAVVVLVIVIVVVVVFVPCRKKKTVPCRLWQVDDVVVN